MPVSLSRIRALLALRSEGVPLSREEQELLTRGARILRRRLDRLQALCPELVEGIELDATLDELARPAALSGSG